MCMSVYTYLSAFPNLQTQLCSLRAQSEYGDYGAASHFDYRYVACWTVSDIPLNLYWEATLYT